MANKPVARARAKTSKKIASKAGKAKRTKTTRKSASKPKSPKRTVKLLHAGNVSRKKAVAAKHKPSVRQPNQPATKGETDTVGDDPGKREGLYGPDPELMEAQSGVWNTLMDYYFRLEINGWERLPDQPALLIGVHSGGPLTMDAWTVIMAWWRHFGETRTLHGTAHDVLMNAPKLGTYFRRLGTISPSRENIQAAFDKGDNVVLWPGGELDAYRTWANRDKAVLGGRKGFIRMAIRAGVPIVPVATVGGHDTLFVLSEGRGLAKALKLKERLRSDVAPITLSVPFGITLHLTPFQHIPLPAKIRTEFLEPIYMDTDPKRVDDQAYVDSMYNEVESVIQAGMARLAKRRKLPIFG